MTDENRYAVYDGFACYFDRYWGRSFFDDLRPIVEQCFLPLLPANGAVLDLCCGSGRLSHWLTVRGFEVSGVDGSEEMVRLARKNAPRASFRVADVRRFREPESFDGVLCTFDSLNHLASGDDLLTVFQNIARSLRPRGAVLFRHESRRRFSGQRAGDLFDRGRGPRLHHRKRLRFPVTAGAARPSPSFAWRTETGGARMSRSGSIAIRESRSLRRWLKRAFRTSRRSRPGRTSLCAPARGDCSCWRRSSRSRRCIPAAENA